MNIRKLLVLFFVALISISVSAQSTYESKGDKVSALKKASIAKSVVAEKPTTTSKDRVANLKSDVFSKEDARKKFTNEKDVDIDHAPKSLEKPKEKAIIKGVESERHDRANELFKNMDSDNFLCGVTMDSIIGYSAYGGSWIADEKSTIEYNANGYIAIWKDYVFDLDTNRWLITDSSVVTFTNGDPLEAVTYLFDYNKKIWYNYERMVFVKDVNGITSESYYEYDTTAHVDSAWVPQERILYSYSSGRVSAITEELFNSGTWEWEFDERAQYAYNTSGFMTSMSEMDKNDDDTYSANTTITYDLAGWGVNEAYKGWYFEEGWSLDMGHESGGLISSEINMYTHDPVTGTYSAGDRSVYTYLELEPYYYYSYDFLTYGDLLETETYYYWDNVEEVWVGDERWISYEYDMYGIRTSFVYSYYDGTEEAWMNWVRYNYFNWDAYIDCNGEAWDDSYYARNEQAWIDGAWVEVYFWDAQWITDDLWRNSQYRFSWDETGILGASTPKWEDIYNYYGGGWPTESSKTWYFDSDVTGYWVLEYRYAASDGIGYDSGDREFYNWFVNELEEELDTTVTPAVWVTTWEAIATVTDEKLVKYTQSDDGDTIDYQEDFTYATNDEIASYTTYTDGVEDYRQLFTWGVYTSPCDSVEMVVIKSFEDANYNVDSVEWIADEKEVYTHDYLGDYIDSCTFEYNVEYWSWDDINTEWDSVGRTIMGDDWYINLIPVSEDGTWAYDEWFYNYNWDDDYYGYKSWYDDGNRWWLEFLETYEESGDEITYTYAEGEGDGLVMVNQDKWYEYDDDDAYKYYEYNWQPASQDWFLIYSEETLYAQGSDCGWNDYYDAVFKYDYLRNILLRVDGYETGVEYNEAGLLIEEWTMQYDTIFGNSGDRDLYEYNDDGRMITHIDQDYNTSFSDWENMYKEEYHYSGVEAISIVDSDVTDVACFGDSTGMIELETFGGRGDLSFVWSNGSTDDVLENVGEGVYSVTITDTAECSFASMKFEVMTTPAWPLESSIASYTPSSAWNAIDGEMTIEIIGGVPPYTYQWNDRLNSEEATMYYAVPGEYQVLTTDALGCTLLTYVYQNYDGATGIEDLLTQNGAVAYPNPSDGRYTLAVQDEFVGGTVSIFRLNGVMIQSNEIKSTNTTVDLTNFEKGMYLMQVVAGERSVMQKLVVE